MTKLTALLTVSGCLVLAGGISSFADKPAPPPQTDIPVTVTLRNAPDDSIITLPGYEAGFSGSINLCCYTEIQPGDMTVWMGASRKGGPPVMINAGPVIGCANGDDPSTDPIYGGPYIIVRGIGAIPSGATEFKSAEFYLPTKSSNPYCFLFGSARVSGPDCSTPVQVTRLDAKHWNIDTLADSNDLATMTWNTSVEKTAIGLKRMPFGLRVYCPTCQ